MAMSKDELLYLIGSLYQTVSAIIFQNEHKASDGDAFDAALLDILAAPEALPLSVAEEKLRAVAEFYWAKGGP